MEWVKSPACLMDSDDSNEVLGLWLRAVLWFSVNEIEGGKIPEKPPRSWPLDKDETETLKASSLVSGSTLLHHPSKEIKAIKKQRNDGRLGGKLGGRPKLNPTPKPPPLSEGSTPDSKDCLNPDKIRLDKTRVDEIREDPSERLFTGEVIPKTKPSQVLSRCSMFIKVFSRETEEERKQALLMLEEKHGCDQVYDTLYAHGKALKTHEAIDLFAVEETVDDGYTQY